MSLRKRRRNDPASQESKVLELLTKFTEELPVPRVIQPVKKKDGSYYHIDMKAFRHSFHRNLPETEVWGYEGCVPGPTIEAESEERVYVEWTSSLPDRHLLPIDHTVHGAEEDVPDVRNVVHLHGASVEWASDGYPEAWFTPGFRQVGPFYQKKVYQYDNQMRACTLWYHDHTLGITRLNIYAGLSGFYLIHDEQERSLNLPKGAYDIPLMLQDKSFNEDGSLYYPDQPEDPVEQLAVSIVPEFVGEVNLVNGKVWPYLNVEPRKYRFRIVNAANTRYYRISLDSGQRLYVIGTDRGLMYTPVGVRSILLGPAERIEIIIDFTNLEGRSVTLRNDAPAPFPDGMEALPETTGTIMQFRVNQPLRHIDTSHIPRTLVRSPVIHEGIAVRQRNLSLDSLRDRYGREWMIQDRKGWDAPISETPKLGTVEVWAFINLTADTHPMHVHLVEFQILERRPFDVDRYRHDGTIRFTGSPIPLEPYERGWKDTVNAHPGQITRIIIRFGPYTGWYVWHCHILEHEDYEMMRPYLVIR